MHTLRLSSCAVVRRTMAHAHATDLPKYGTLSISVGQAAGAGRNCRCAAIPVVSLPVAGCRVGCYLGTHAGVHERSHARFTLPA